MTAVALKYSDLPVGTRFTRWTIAGPYVNIKTPQNKSRVFYPCVCDCGWDKFVCVNKLLSGESKSCGCLTRTGDFRRSHGGSATALYSRWAGMITRCTNPNQKRWENYGARGIKVCAEWHDFSVFRDWAMANGYNQVLDLDRIDTNGDYEPGNCRFVTGAVNQRNKTSNVMVTAFGETKCLSEWYEDGRPAVCHASYRRRVRNGWPHEAALFTPRISGNRHTGRREAPSETEAL